MMSMRRHYVASTSVGRHVPAGIWPPQYSKPSYDTGTGIQERTAQIH